MIGTFISLIVSFVFLLVIAFPFYLVGTLANRTGNKLSSIRLVILGFSTIVKWSFKIKKMTDEMKPPAQSK